MNCMWVSPRYIKPWVSLFKEVGNELSSRYFDKKKRDAIVNFRKQRNSNFISNKMHETAFNGYIMNT